MANDPQCTPLGTASVSHRRTYPSFATQALLVHDPSLPSAAMSANVETGFFDDPDEYPGEHPSAP